MAKFASDILRTGCGAGDYGMRFAECRRGTTTIKDGAWGTEFQRLGAEIGACTDEWNLTKPELVRQLAASYVAAGSRVILTNTYRANSISLTQYGLQDRLEELNRAAVKIPKQVAGDDAVVFAAIGPSGKSMQQFRRYRSGLSPTQACPK